jgi:predicted DNA-binding transcriptional regulator AlpA
LGLGERKLWELTNCGEIPHIKLGKCVLYPVDALRDWLAKQAAKGARR